MSKTVVLDIDGVLADFEGQLVRELGKKFGSVGYDYRDKYRLEERFSNYPLVLEHAKMCAADHNFYYGLQLHEGAQTFVESLLDDGFEILYVSSRPAISHSYTRRWLIRHFTDIEPNLHCGVGDKVAFLTSYGVKVDFVVEDNPYHIKQLKEAGFVVVCWAQKWNEKIFPRLYVRSDGEIMLWADEAIEAEPFFVPETESGETS